MRKNESEMERHRNTLVLVQLRSLLLVFAIFASTLNAAVLHHPANSPKETSSHKEIRTSRDIQQGPQNTVVIAGSTTILTCIVSDFPLAVRIIWTEFVTRQFETTISDGVKIDAGHPNRDRYSIVQGSSSEFSLQISTQGMADAGVYKCRDSPALESHTVCAELIVLEDVPKCLSYFDETGGVVPIGSRQFVVCNVRYKGSHNPLMTWSRIDDQFELEEGIVDEPNGVRRAYSQLTFTVTAAMNGRVLGLRTEFTKRVGAPPNLCASYMAQNEPNYRHELYLPTLIVIDNV